MPRWCRSRDHTSVPYLLRSIHIHRLSLMSPQELTHGKYPMNRNHTYTYSNLRDATTRALFSTYHPEKELPSVLCCRLRCMLNSVQVAQGTDFDCYSLDVGTEHILMTPKTRCAMIIAAPRVGSTGVGSIRTHRHPPDI